GNLRQKVIQDVVGIVLRSEKETNQRIDRVEAKLLALKITVKLEAYGVVFDEDKFLQAVALNSTLVGAAGTVRKLLPPKEEHIDEDASVARSVGTRSIASGRDDVYDMFYMRGGQQRRGSGQAASEGGVSLAKRRRSTFETRWHERAAS
ncbi:hypothetical protein ACHAXR_000002, partial [Thalassiosira sp. AJA248-18]